MANDIRLPARGSRLPTVAAVVLAGALVIGQAPADPLRPVAEQYVKLVLAVGQHDADYVDAFYGPPEWRKEVDRIIYEELAAGRVVRDSQRKLKTLITELQKQKVQAVVLGCTELVLAVDVRANVLPVYDTTAIHARAAVDWMLEEKEQARAAA